MAKKIKKRLSLFYLIIAIIILTATFLLINKNNLFNKNYKTKIDISEQDLDIVYGLDSTDLTIFLFSNYTCSFCRKFFKTVYPELKKEYIDNGKVKLVVKPLAFSSNKSVINSLKIAVCINKFGNFETLNKLLLTEPNVIYTKEFSNVVDEFTEKDIFIAECMYGGESETYIYKNIIEFKNLKCSGTPTFIINNNIYKGYIKYDKFKKIIEKELLSLLH